MVQRWNNEREGLLNYVGNQTIELAILEEHKEEHVEQDIIFTEDTSSFFTLICC